MEICGFYPDSRPGEHQSDTTPTFNEARADFERAWRVFLSKRTEADFQAWRDQKRLDRAKICAVGCRQETGAAQLWTGQAVQSLLEVSLRRDIRHALR